MPKPLEHPIQAQSSVQTPWESTQESHGTKSKAHDTNGGRASEGDFAHILNEGRPAGQPRVDQTKGHRGGFRRQTQNKGRR